MISLENIALSERSQHKARTWYDAITVYEMSRIGTSTRQEALVVPTGRGGDMGQNANRDSSSSLSHENVPNWWQ